MDEKNGVRKYLTDTITMVFATSLLGASASGLIMNNFVREDLLWIGSGGFFVIGAEGISYASIFQLFGMSVTLSVLLLIFVSDFFLSKYMLVWRYMIFMGLALIAISLFVVVFRWFPPGVWQGWASLLGAFTVFSSVSMIPTFIKIKREDKEYEKALSEYKSKQAKEPQ